MLKDARIRQVLGEIAEGRWKRRAQFSLVLGTLYVAVTLVGASMAIARTLGVLH